MTPFQILVLKGIRVLIKMSLAPRFPDHMPINEKIAQTDKLWKEETYPMLLEWDKQVDEALNLEEVKHD